MAIETAIQRYYDLHPTEKDLMGDNRLQDTGSDRIVHVLRWMYRHENWYVPRNLNVYVTADPNEPPIEPDVALFKGVIASQLPENLPSWTVGPTNPYTGGKTVAPTVVFEIASERTWKKDRDNKPRAYAAMGAKEYYWLVPRDAHIPREVRAVPVWGWRGVNGRPEPMQTDPRGWIWSQELESWVGAEGNLLQLYDRNGKLRPTGEEAERAAREAVQAEEARERAAREAAQTAEARERAAKEAERAAKEAERAAKERAWAKLRELGIDPESLGS